MTLPPLALYVHIPWCEKKCPYCDFNSHTSPNIPEDDYVSHLINELQQYRQVLQIRPLHSIFFGGGTPSLFSAPAIARILTAVSAIGSLEDNCEITLEANPGSAEQSRFKGYRQAGVNRLSIGVQSFNSDHLKRLGRIHNHDEAINAIKAAQSAGFDNINIDLMYGLSQQTLAQALSDIEQAIALNPQHISWYQLTIEANTAFYNAPPPLPAEDNIIAIEEAGRALLLQHGFARYEVSAYAQPNLRSKHNMNYWEFGDYLGIGAGAHSKLTDENGAIRRIANTRLPQHYLDRNAIKASTESSLTPADKRFEFMMNALRLVDGVDVTLFEQRTGETLQSITPTITAMTKSQHMQSPQRAQRLACTKEGYELLNSVVEQFLED